MNKGRALIRRGRTVVMWSPDEERKPATPWWFVLWARGARSEATYRACGATRGIERELDVYGEITTGNDGSWPMVQTL